VFHFYGFISSAISFVPSPMGASVHAMYGIGKPVNVRPPHLCPSLQASQISHTLWLMVPQSCKAGKRLFTGSEKRCKTTKGVKAAVYCSFFFFFDSNKTDLALKMNSTMFVIVGGRKTQESGGEALNRRKQVGVQKPSPRLAAIFIGFPKKDAFLIIFLCKFLLIIIF